ncbi:hypothetical protein D9M70_376220 [compost metagenome]
MKPLACQQAQPIRRNPTDGEVVEVVGVVARTDERERGELGVPLPFQMPAEGRLRGMVRDPVHGQRHAGLFAQGADERFVDPRILIRVDRVVGQ